MSGDDKISTYEELLDMYDGEMPDDYQVAKNIVPLKCAECNGVHLILGDEDGEPFAEVVLDEELIEAITAKLREQRN